MDFENYLGEHIKEGIIDFAIRAQEDSNGDVKFYIYPNGRDGKTMDFKVKGNVLVPII
jgi:hypothetical protein